MSDAKTVQDLLDHQAITERIYRYCRAVDRMDAPMGYSIFHADSIADYGGMYTGPGRGVIDFICKSHLQLTHHSHQVTNVTINLKGDRAGSEAYAIVNNRAKRGDGFFQMTMWVRYIDRWSKRGGVWGIDKRFMAMDFDELRDIKPLGNPERGIRGPEDQAYAFLNLDEAVR